MTQDQSSFQAITRAVFNTATLGGTYAPLNTTAGFSDDIKILKIINMGTQGVDISYDGVTDNDFVPPFAPGTNVVPFVLNLQTNHACNSSNGSGTLNGRKGQIIWGKGTAGVGNLYIIGYR